MPHGLAYHSMYNGHIMGLGLEGAKCDCPGKAGLPQTHQKVIFIQTVKDIILLNKQTSVLALGLEYYMSVWIT